MSVCCLQFSVGGYVMPRLVMRHMNPDITIFSIHVCLLQTYTIVPLEEFKVDPESTARLHYPTETFVLRKDGYTPTSKRPKTDSAFLFSGRTHEGKVHQTDGVQFTWEPGRIRLPDDHHARPSKAPCTVSPFDIQHSLSLRVFFSVRGESLNGERIHGEDDTGELRMLVINLPEQVSSVCSGQFLRSQLPPDHVIVRRCSVVAPKNGSRYRAVSRFVFLDIPS